LAQKQQPKKDKRKKKKEKKEKKKRKKEKEKEKRSECSIFPQLLLQNQVPHIRIKAQFGPRSPNPERASKKRRNPSLNANDNGGPFKPPSLHRFLPDSIESGVHQGNKQVQHHNRAHNDVDNKVNGRDNSFCPSVKAFVC